MAFYTGYKKKHRLKNQSTGAANGFCVHSTRAYSCRRHDVHLFRDLELNVSLSELTYLMLFGDSAYPELSNITSGFGLIMTVLMKKALSGCRESIEWMYRDLNIYWKIMDRPNLMVLLNGYQRASNIIIKLYSPDRVS
jgi:hypothetical protein